MRLAGWKHPDTVCLTPQFDCGPNLGRWLQRRLRLPGGLGFGEHDSDEALGRGRSSARAHCSARGTVGRDSELLCRPTNQRTIVHWHGVDPAVDYFRPRPRASSELRAAQPERAARDCYARVVFRVSLSAEHAAPWAGLVTRK